MPLTVSVVVPTFKRNQLLQRCVEAIISQTLEKSQYEIIIVDDGASEETRKLIEKYSSRRAEPVIRYLPVLGTHGPAAARNIGWRAAQGSIIAFTDDDCIPEADWLTKGTSRFRDDVDGVWGRIRVPVDSPPTDYERNTSFLESAEFATANCFYRKEALAEVNGFDERFTKAWREDTDLYFSLLKRGKQLLSAPDAVVVHPVRTGYWGISIREQSKSMFNALLYKKHTQLYRQKLPNALLPYYYVIVTSFFLFLFSNALGMRLLEIFSFCAWVCGTGFVCLKRLKGTSHSLGHIFEMAITSTLIPFFSLFWRVRGAIKFNVLFY